MKFLFVYTERKSPRLEYIFKFLFEEVLQIPFVCTTNENDIPNHPFLNYSKKNINHGLQIIPHALLFEQGIQPQTITIDTWNKLPTFFTTNGSFIKFDIFAASFYLLTRYEEYGNKTVDEFGRYPHQHSLAFKNNFLDIPLINLWCIHLWKGLQYYSTTFEALDLPKQFAICSYDIDIAYSYQNKGFFRNFGGLLRDLQSLELQKVIERILCVLRLQKDPYDAFEYLKNIHLQTEVPAIYFFLLAQKRSAYDKNLDPEREAMHRLIAQVSQYASVGIHPSFESWQNSYRLRKEIKILALAIDEEVKSSRQHYIRFEYPDTFIHVQRHGILVDYSLGYGSINGFRASTGHPHHFYNVLEDKVYTIRLCPFSWMDANSKFEQGQDISTTEREINHYIDKCKLGNTPLVTIWHNYSLGTAPEWEGWRALHSLFLQKIKRG